MRRPPNSMPPMLRRLTYNIKTGFYEIDENGILYRMNLEQTRSLRDYFRSALGAKYPSIADWYRFTGKEDRRLVIREGDVPVPRAGADGFYPDPEWPE